MKEVTIFKLKFSVKSDVGVTMNPSQCAWVLSEIARLEACLEQAREAVVANTPDIANQP